MSEIIIQLAALYSDYLRDMERITREQHNLRGAFARLLGGSAAGTGSDSCNDRFTEGLTALVDKLSEGCSCEDASAVIGYVIDPARESDAPQPARLMIQAVHGCVLPLVEALSRTDAGRLAAEYSASLAGSAPLPVQKQLLSALRKRGE